MQPESKTPATGGVVCLALVEPLENSLSIVRGNATTRIRNFDHQEPRILRKHVRREANASTGRGELESVVR